MTKLRSMKRVAAGRRHDFVVTLEADTVTLRPKRVRRPEAEVSVTWDQVYQWALLARPRKHRKVSRGLLSTEGR